MNDINVVIQSYNYGGGYADYVAKNGKSTASILQKISQRINPAVQK